MAAVDPVFIHGGEQLQDVPFLEAQVTVGGARVVAQRPNCPAQQMPSGPHLPRDTRYHREAPAGRRRGFDAHVWSQCPPSPRPPGRDAKTMDLSKKPHHKTVLGSRSRARAALAQTWRGDLGQGQRRLGRREMVWDGHSPSVLAWTDAGQAQKDHHSFSELPQFGQSCHIRLL